MRQLFLNYCDFNVDTGDIFITQLNLIKLLKDSKLFDSRLTQQRFGILLSKEFRVPANHIKSLTFEQFLNVVLKIAETREPQAFR